MKLSAWAKKQGVHYLTAWRMWNRGEIPNARQLPTGTVIISEDINEVKKKEPYTVVYSRVSSSLNKGNLDSQCKRLTDFCVANGWVVNEAIKEIGSGLNDRRQKLLKILDDKKATRIVVEHKDRLSRFGIPYIERCCSSFDCEIIFVNNTETDKEDLVQDFVSVITSFCARLYGQRRCKRNTEKLIESLKNE